jgi:hypothetical protein
LAVALRDTKTVLTSPASSLPMNAKTLRRHGVQAEVWPETDGMHLAERLRAAHRA